MIGWIIFGIVIGVLFLLLIILFILSNILFNQFFKRKKEMTLEDTDFIKKHPEILERDKRVRSRTYEDLYIESFDHLKLHGYYFKAPKETNKTVISVHGWYGNALSDSVLMNDFLIDDYNFLNIDLRAHGKSQGKYLGFSILDYRDVIDWTKKLVEKDSNVEILLYGASMGAATCMLTSNKNISNVKAIIADCGFTQAYQELKFALKHMIHIPSFLILPIVNIIAKLKAHYSFRSLNALDSLKETTLPMLFIHGEKDTFVDPLFSKMAYEACGSSAKEYYTFNNATHAASYLNNPDKYQLIVKDFLKKYF